MTNKEWILKELSESDEKLAQARITLTENDDGFYFYRGDFCRLFDDGVRHYEDAIRKEVEWLHAEHKENKND